MTDRRLLLLLLAVGLLILGCVQQASDEQSTTREITIPHSGQKVNLTIDSIQSDRYSFEIRAHSYGTANITYEESSGVHIGMHLSVNYSDPAIAYRFNRDEYSGAKDRYECTRGDCASLIGKDPASIYREPGGEDCSTYTLTVCLPNGTYYKTTNGEGAYLFNSTAVVIVDGRLYVIDPNSPPAQFDVAATIDQFNKAQEAYDLANNESASINLSSEDVGNLTDGGGACNSGFEIDSYSNNGKILLRVHNVSRTNNNGTGCPQ